MVERVRCRSSSLKSPLSRIPTSFRSFRLTTSPLDPVSQNILSSLTSSGLAVPETSHPSTPVKYQRDYGPVFYASCRLCQTTFPYMEVLPRGLSLSYAYRQAPQDLLYSRV